ncbi:MAG: hypothetical protein NT051_06995 [Candidatus Micrarchaeota archaeon]|nr:hypothetical protein [Candidatus Micrarchaeota archaeon]
MHKTKQANHVFLAIVNQSNQFGKQNLHLSEKEIQKMLMQAVGLKKGEKLLFLTDYPDTPETNPVKQDRMELLTRWKLAAEKLSKTAGFIVLPLAKYLEAGRHGADFPSSGFVGEQEVKNFPAYIASADVVIAMNTFSATVPLKEIGKANNRTRGLSMPTVESSMEPAMCVDYEKMTARGEKLRTIVANAVSFEVEFKGNGVPQGTILRLDTRANAWHLSTGVSIIPGEFTNLPGTELYTPLYEGTSAEARAALGDSKTEGTWAVYSPKDSQVVLLKVKNNKIIEVPGDSIMAQEMRALIRAEPNNANLAELGLGLNSLARSGDDIPILEKEKAGPHIAYGTSSHFGKPGSWAGTVQASVHIDEVYTRTTEITVDIHAVFADGTRILIAKEGKIVAV